VGQVVICGLFSIFVYKGLNESSQNQEIYLKTNLKQKDFKTLSLVRAVTGCLNYMLMLTCKLFGIFLKINI